MMYFEHILAAIAVQVVVRLFTREWWTGAVLASGYFIGREVAQAEYRWIEVFGQGLRANMPWWGPFDLRVWPKADQWVDVLGPLAATFALAAVLSLRGRRRP